MTDDKAADRVRKLLALAANNPSVEEAAAAFALAQEIATRHALDLDDVGSADSDDPDSDPARTLEPPCTDCVYPARRRAAWLASLLNAIAKANHVGWYWSHGRGWMAYGQPADVATVGYMVQAIGRDIDRMAKAQGAGMGRSWARNFRIGAADEIGKRLQTAAADAMAGARETAYNTGGETALARVDTALARIDAAKASTAAFGKTLGLVSSRGLQGAGGYGYGAGRRAGRSVHLGGGSKAIGS